MPNLRRSESKEYYHPERGSGLEWPILQGESKASGNPTARPLRARLCDSLKGATEGSGISRGMGIAASTPERTPDATSPVKMADQAMYLAKEETGYSVRTLHERPE